MPAKKYDVNALIKELKNATFLLKSKLFKSVTLALLIVFLVNLISFVMLQFSLNQLQKMMDISILANQIINELGEDGDRTFVLVNSYRTNPDPEIKKKIQVRARECYKNSSTILRYVSTEDSYYRVESVRNLISYYVENLNVFFKSAAISGNSVESTENSRKVKNAVRFIQLAVQEFLTYELAVQQKLKKKIDLQTWITIVLGIFSSILVTGLILYWLRNFSHKITQPVYNSTEILERAQNQTEKDMKMAANIQHTLFPKQIPLLTDYEIALFNQAPLPISGDMWDIYHEDGVLGALWLFDVTGHGTSAGLITMLAKTIFRRYFTLGNDETLNESANKINKSLIRELIGTEQYCTGILLKIMGERIEYVNAGHPDLIMKRSDAEAVKVLPKQGESDNYKGMMFGVEGSVKEYEPMTFRMDANDLIVLYTDGFTESRNTEEEEFHEKRLLDFLNQVDSRLPAQEILNRLLVAQQEFIGDNEEGIFDDASIILLKKK